MAKHQTNGLLSRDDMKLYAYVGLCLSCVQLAERALQSAINTVLDDEGIRIAEQSEPERKQTLGDFLKKLKRRVRLPARVKDDLYTFLKMRNEFVHESHFDFRTSDGCEKARLFLLELIFRALSIAGLIVAVYQVWARDEHDEEFFDEEFFDEALFEMSSDQHRLIVQHFEQHYGSLARQILAGRAKRQTN